MYVYECFRAIGFQPRRIPWGNPENYVHLIIRYSRIYSYSAMEEMLRSMYAYGEVKDRQVCSKQAEKNSVWHDFKEELTPSI